MRDQVGEFEYAEAGSGPPVLLLPGSFGTGAARKSVHERLGPDYRVVTTSLLGYGRTQEMRPDGNSTMAQQVAVIDAIIDRMGAAPHVVGHSFGGLAALVHALTGRHRPASLSLVEANPLGLLRVTGDDEHYDQFGRMTERYFAAFAAHEPESARYVIDFYGGAGAFDALPRPVRSYVVATTPVNVRDWSSGTPFEPTADALRSIAVPTVVVRGERSHPAMLRIAERLAGSIPNARLVTVEGGSHFLPSTHPNEIAALIRQQAGEPRRG
jgi:pimeloyl-ACP methyl ester carboxylesterase